MRKKIMSGNWKMNLNLAQATELAEGIKKGLDSKKTSLELLVFLFDPFFRSSIKCTGFFQAAGIIAYLHSGRRTLCHFRAQCHKDCRQHQHDGLCVQLRYI